MGYSRLAERLADEGCGLYFLAGLDTNGAGDGPDVLTVHATEGAIGEGHQRFIADRIAESHPDIEVRIHFHSTQALYEPDSLEGFARLFEHDHIVADPTGAFARVSGLLKLARLIRAEVGHAIERLLWQADISSLVVVTRPLDPDMPAVEKRESADRLRAEITSLIESHACPELKEAVRSVRVCDAPPPGRFTAIHSVPRAVAPPRKRRVAGLLGRIPWIAALIGLGTFSAANARTPVTAEDGLPLPGITGLVGLTTLGENSYGLRNRYQAMGGLRLYFGDTGVLMRSSFRPGISRAEEGSDRTRLASSKPNRIPYGP